MISWDVKNDRYVMVGLDTKNEVDCNVVNETVDTSSDDEDKYETITCAPTGNEPALKVDDQEAAGLI